MQRPLLTSDDSSAHASLTYTVRHFDSKMGDT
jgi:hypothetical protein